MRLRGSVAVMLVALVSASAHAECERDGLSLFPAPGGLLPANTHFILEGVGEEQNRVSALVGKRLVLKTTDDEVLLRIQPGWTSRRGRVAVKLTPSRPLKPQRTYTLELDRLLPRARLLNPVPGTDQASWRIGKGNDQDPPQWKQPPVPEEGQYDRQGDEVTRWIYLRTVMVEESPAYVVVTLRRRRTSETQVYFAPLNGEQIRLGHDACSGNFALENRASYRATIEAHDCAENTASPQPPVELSSPAPVRQ
jgi:hypothetical protein